MKIALVGNDHLQQFPLVGYGGIEANVEALAQGLSRDGSDFYVVVPARVCQTAVPYDFDVAETNCSPTFSGGSLRGFVEDAINIISYRGTDIVWGQSYWSALISKRLQVPCICSIHDSCDPIPGWFVDSPLVRYRFFSEFQRSRWAITKEQQNASFVCWHGLKGDEYGKTNLQRDYHLFVGGLSWGYRNKGLDLVVLLAVLNPNENFVIYGSGDHNLENFLLNLASNVQNIFFGGTLERGSKHQDAFSRAKSLLMFTRLPEAFGRVTIEALACGTPVFGSRFGALPEIIRTPTDGALFEIGDTPPEVDFHFIYDHKKIAVDSLRFDISHEVSTMTKASKDLIRSCRL